MKKYIFIALALLFLNFLGSILQDLFIPTTVRFSSISNDQNICVEIKHWRQKDSKCLEGKKEIKLIIKKTADDALYLKISINSKIIFDDSIVYLGSMYPMRCKVKYISFGKVITKCDKANIFNTYFD